MSLTSQRCRFTYRLRLSSSARRGLEAEWARCRWLWNECVAMSRKVCARNQATGGREACDPAQLDRMLTGARRSMAWLREGSSVAQQQTTRDVGRSRAKALRDVKAGLPLHQRAGMAKIKRKRDAFVSLNCTRRGFRLNSGRLYVAGDIVLRVVWSRELPGQASSVRVYRDGLGHWYCLFVVWPGSSRSCPRQAR